MTKARRLGKGDSFVVITNEDPKFLGIKDGGVGINEALERGKACLGCRYAWLFVSFFTRFKLHIYVMLGVERW